MSAPLKVCTKCRKPQPLDGFRKRGDGSDKLHPWCCDCQRAWNRAYQKARYVPTGYPRGPRERWTVA